jgi:hypothetical protein
VAGADRVAVAGLAVGPLAGVAVHRVVADEPDGAVGQQAAEPAAGQRGEGSSFNKPFEAGETLTANAS